MIGSLFFGSPAIPDAGKDKNDTTGGREINQKRQGQNKVSGHGGAQRQRAAQVTVKRAGPRILHTFLKQQLRGPVILGQRRRTLVGTDQARRYGRPGAAGTQRPAAIGANANRLGLVFGAFHGLKLRHCRWQCNPKLATGIVWWGESNSINPGPGGHRLHCAAGGA